MFCHLITFFRKSFVLPFALLLFAVSAAAAPPTNFNQAKVLLKERVYHDQNVSGALGTLYCGCDWRWTGRSGGVVDHASCGYEVRAQANRANRIEWEHVMPASHFGQQRQCWQAGGRSNCTANDSFFSLMEADMHNLSPAIGEVNADRSNYRFGVAGSGSVTYGQCSSKTNFKGRVFEPRDEAKGFVARVNFYMHDRYNLRMSEQQQRLFLAWDKAYPVSAWELERNRRIAAVTGNANPFVTGERVWSLGHKNAGDGLLAGGAGGAGGAAKAAGAAGSDGVVRGNRNSKIYHLVGCPSFDAMSARNIVQFSSEKDALAAGYRKAGNCP